MDGQDNCKKMIRYCYDYGRYLMVVNKNITREYFLTKSGVVGGYAKDMFVRLYDAIFTESDNLVQTYDRYFKQEFDSLGEMLLKKYYVPKETVEKFIVLLNKRSDCTLICFDSITYGENLEVLLSSGVFDTRLEKLLLMEL